MKLVAMVAVAAVAAGGELRVVPAPRKVHLEAGRFVVDDRTALLVSAQATRATRLAARTVQLGLRDRFGIDLPVIRISERGKHQPFKPIWVVEPRLLRPPARTIGVKGLRFGPEMFYEGYFIRVDAVEAVLHGASAAGSFYAAWAFLQLLEPARPRTLFSKGRGPSVRCLWLADWPQRRWRVLPAGVEVPSTVGEAAALLRLAARYRFNVVPREALPATVAGAGEARQVMSLYPLRFLDEVGEAPGAINQVPPAGKPPPTQRAEELHRLAERAIAAGDWEVALAALGEVAWGPPDPSAEQLLRMVGRIRVGGGASAHQQR